MLISRLKLFLLNNPAAGIYVTHLLLVVLVSAMITPGASTIRPAPGTTNPGFALAELYTSEGCSSCPPADQVAARIQQENPNAPVYILAWHIDYWNRLGWKDRFSSPEYSRRQQQYAAWLHASAYTPQVIMNGSIQFIGAAAGTFRNTVTTCLHRPARATLNLWAVKVSQVEASFTFAAAGATAGSTLFITLVQKTAHTEVLSGENSGRSLAHIQAVRLLKSVPLTGTRAGHTSVHLLPDQPLENQELIAFLQVDATGEIIAATRAGLTTSGTVAAGK